ncbi:hypothetical protein ACFL35_01400 [Candidatus Riflebacteria bacterium]
MERHIIFVAIVFFAASFFFPAPIVAFSRGYKLEIIIKHDAGTFRYKTYIKRHMRFDFETNPRSTIKPFMLAAKKQLAIAHGYSPQRYGSEHYKMIRVQKYYWHLLDGFGEIIIRTRRK